jgi:hypothetical protein
MVASDVWGFNNSVANMFILQGYVTVSLGNWFLVFQDNIVVSTLGMEILIDTAYLRRMNTQISAVSVPAEPCTPQS